MLNVALGGTLLVDIASQKPKALNHRRMARKMEPVHEVRIAPRSLLGKITGREKLGVNSTHHQAIGDLAPSLRPFMLGVQFHPERLIDRDGVFLQIFSSFIEACERSRRRL